MRKYPDVSRLVPRTCSRGFLHADPAAVSAAFAVSGTYLIRDAAGEDSSGKPWAQGTIPVLNFAKESSECTDKFSGEVAEQKTVQAREATEKRAADAAAYAKWKYHVELSNPKQCLVEVIADENKFDKSKDTVGEKVQFNVNSSLKFQADCDPHKSEISVTVNGIPKELVWKETFYTDWDTTVVP